MRRLLPYFVFALTCAITLSVAADEIDFEKQIRRLLISRCGKCHGANAQKGGLRLDARHFAFKGGDSGEVIVAGKSDESELLRRLTSDDTDERMPPETGALPKAEIELLTRWIDGGANWPETDYDRAARRDPRLKHWAFQPLSTIDPAQLANKGQNPIDVFIGDALQEKGLAFSPEAKRPTLIRRLWFDMLGLPPTIEQVRAFEANKDPRAWEQLVDAALRSPRYGERWAQHWLDIVRYADTHGFEVNTPRENAWPYRDYVIRSLNSDKPYDEFLREQLAGDALGADEATGFLVAAAVLLPGQIGKDDISKRLARQDALDEIIQGTSATMLGLTIGCARCHDHKFDPITQRDYYSMQAFFAGVEYGDREITDDARKEQLAEAKRLDVEIAELEQRLREFESPAFAGRTLVIDEQDKERVTFLKPENGPGANPAGAKPGYKSDVGAADRSANLSRGQYTWWNNTPGEDIATYAPGVAGRFRLWLSWGAHGSGVHTRDARYVLDDDGDLQTKDDQRELAKVDQYYRAGLTTGETEMKPLWSGLLDVGVVELQATTKLVLRGGKTGTGITADVVVLQESIDENAAPKNKLPALRAPVNAAQNVEQFAPASAKFVRLTTLATIDDNRHEPCIDELQVFSTQDASTNLALASGGAKASSSGNYSETGKHQLKHVNDDRFGNDRSWISNEHGGGWVQIELPAAASIERIVWGRDRNSKFKDRLPVRYRIEVSRDGVDWHLVATHQDRVAIGTPFDETQALLRRQPTDSSSDIKALIDQVSQLRGKKTKLEAPRMVYGGAFRKPETTFVLRRGDPEQRADPIGPAVPVIFRAQAETPESNEQQRRITLAEWIASPSNPLTARVLVNRIWMYHFGRGIVATPSDFGLNGARPSHPKLLDWLAGEFIRSGWSIKHMHRLMLTSRTYRQAHQINPAFAKIDGDNRALWRFASRRLEGEAIRDSMLAVSGELNLKMGGPGFDFFKTRGGLSGFPSVDEFGAEQLRRMIYAHKIRMERVPVFGAFDCPDAGQATPLRSQSTTAVQALNLFNSEFVAKRAERFASRIQAAADKDSTDHVTKAFELALGRQPSTVEQRACEEVVNDHGLETLCRVLFNSNEFLFLP